MPLEIKELHIKVSVNQPGTSNSPPPQPNNEGQNKNQLVAECVEQAVKIINQKKER